MDNYKSFQLIFNNYFQLIINLLNANNFLFSIINMHITQL